MYYGEYGDLTLEGKHNVVRIPMVEIHALDTTGIESLMTSSVVTMYRQTEHRKKRVVA